VRGKGKVEVQTEGGGAYLRDGEREEVKWNERKGRASEGVTIKPDSPYRKMERRNVQ